MKQLIYLDNAATTKTRPEVVEAMLPYFSEYYGNPSSVYEFSTITKKAVTGARETIAKSLGARTEEIYFTAGGSESDNWARTATAEAYQSKGKHIIKVCAGTACHVRKSQPIFDAVHDYLGLSGKKKTSADGMFTLETVACLGACGLAPVMTIDGEVHSKMTPEAALSLLEEIREKEASVHAAD